MRVIIYATSVILFLFNSCHTSAQSIQLSDYTISLFTLSFNNKNPDLKFWNEVPPVIINRGQSFDYISTTYFSTAWQSRQSLATPIDDIINIQLNSQKGDNYITSSLHWWQEFYKPKLLNSKEDYKHNYEWQNYHWRRNYNGIFSAHIIESESLNRKIIFALSHGENKNEIIGNYVYQNTVRPNFKINKRDSKTFSGGKPYKDCWEAYFGFLNGNWTIDESKKPLGKEYFNDIGPIAWPSAGYISTNGEQASNGLRHPSSIIHNGYLYIYVVDESFDGSNGIKLIRVKTANALDPSKYATWANGEWISALPTGFNKNNIVYFFNKRGPSNSAILPRTHSIIRFSVAKIENSENEFVGVEEYLDQHSAIHVALRFSYDLITWSDQQIVYSAPNWQASKVRYPVFLNSDGTSHNEIDKGEFYILGAAGDGTITKLYFKKKIEGSQFNPNTTKENESKSGKSLDKLYVSPKQYFDNLQFEMIQIVPTASSSNVNLNFTVNKLSRIHVNLYNSNGRLVSKLLEETFKPQAVSRSIDISKLLPGIYFVEISDYKYRVVKKLLKI